jgi:hypothetical protein
MLDKGFNPDRCGAQNRYGRQAGAGDTMRLLGGFVWDGAAVADGLREKVDGQISTACWGGDENDEKVL